MKKHINNTTANTQGKLEDIQLDGIHMWDAPDFVDAYISYATRNGVPLTDEELDELNEDSQFVYECVMDWIY